MTDTQLDILEIKQTLREMNKSIEKIKKTLRDDYFNEKIIEFYNNEPSEDDRFERLQQLDAKLCQYIKARNGLQGKMREICDDIIRQIHAEYMDTVLDIEE